MRGTDDAVVDLLVERLGAELGDRVFAIDDHRSVVELVAAELTARRLAPGGRRELHRRTARRSGHGGGGIERVVRRVAW